MTSRARDNGVDGAGKPLNENTIDQLYGLEPVIEVDAAQDSGPTPFVTISCPYCGESYETRVDLTGGSFDYVEDCQICCQPIELHIEVNEAGELTSMTAQQLNE